jgi:hypothetical protein
MTTRLHLAAAAALIAGGLGMASGAQAAPIGAGLAGASGDGLITHVAQGCGPGFHRGPYGGCRPNVGPRGFYAPRRFERRCWVRPTPFGPRRVCR